MANAPLISVIMSVYNAEKYIGDCINSILEQTMDDFEFIIINDASTDRSQHIIREFDDNRIVLLNNEERKYPVTRNRGLDIARGKYICIMDADDVSLPYRLEHQASFMEDHSEFGLAGSGYRIFGREQDLFREADYEKIKVHLLRNNNFIHPSIIIRHYLIRKHKLRYNERFCYSQDYDLLVRAARYFPVTNIQEVLMHYRVHPGQITMKSRPEQTEFADEISIDQVKYIGLDPDKEERRLHLDLLKGYALDYSQKDKMYRWIEKMLNRNHKVRFYDEEELETLFSALLTKQSFIRLNRNHKSVPIPQKVTGRSDLNDVTFVFPVRIESQYRVKNLDAILKYIAGNFDTNITILESDTEQRYFDYSFYNKVTYRFLMDKDEVFQRTNLRNRMISEVQTPFVAVFDSDSISTVEQIIDSVEALRKGDVIMSIPFDGRYFLCDDDLSDLFIRTQDTDLLIKNQANLKLMFGYYCVGGAYIVKKDEFLNAGGENENIRGWGCEDTERVKNLEVRDKNIHYSTGPLFHLWHPRGKNNHFADQGIKKNNINELLKTCRAERRAEGIKTTRFY